MKVIKEVNKPKMHKCECCKSIYSYTQKDVDDFWRPTMKCPVCKKVNTPSIFDRKIREER